MYVIAVLAFFFTSEPVIAAILTLSEFNCALVVFICVFSWTLQVEENSRRFDKGRPISKAYLLAVQYFCLQPCRPVLTCNQAPCNDISLLNEDTFNSRQASITVHSSVWH